MATDTVHVTMGDLFFSRIPDSDHFHCIEQGAPRKWVIEIDVGVELARLSDNDIAPTVFRLNDSQCPAL